MAMIQCPECGQNISDKASKCIHCGKNLIEETETDTLRKCLECGSDISDVDTYCPACGCPIETHQDIAASAVQSVEVTSVKVSKRTKKIAIISVIAVVACALLIFTIKYIGNVQAEKEFTATYNAYIDNLEKVQVLMISGGAEAETLCNLTYSVWHNAIYKDLDSKTDPYTRPNGFFVSDFNTALSNLYAAYSTKTTVSDIEKNQTAVKEIVKNLQSPPEGLGKCYDTLSDLHSAYKALTDLAISPSGNLAGFYDKKSSSVSDFMSAYEKLDNQIPERKADK